MAALHDMPAGTQEQVACYCCGESIEAGSIIRFERHPGDGVCFGCAAWLHKRGMAIGHEVHRPFWRRLTRKGFTPG